MLQRPYGHRYESASADLSLEADPLTGDRYSFAGGNPINNIEDDGHYNCGPRITGGPCEKMSQRERNAPASPAHQQARRNQLASEGIGGQPHSPGGQDVKGRAVGGRPLSHTGPAPERPAPTQPAKRSPLQIPNPGESAVDRFFGRGLHPPEEAPRVLKGGGAGSLIRTAGEAILGKGKAGAPRTDLVLDGGLKAHEQAGHTIERHVAKTDDYLKERLAKAPKLKQASTYGSRDLAEEATAGTIRAHEGLFKAWQGSKEPLVLRPSFDRPIGKVMLRSGETRATNQARVILRRDNSAQGYNVRTSFPE